MKSLDNLLKNEDDFWLEIVHPLMKTYKVESLAVAQNVPAYLGAGINIKNKDKNIMIGRLNYTNLESQLKEEFNSTIQQLFLPENIEALTDFDAVVLDYKTEQTNSYIKIYNFLDYKDLDEKILFVDLNYTNQQPMSSIIADIKQELIEEKERLDYWKKSSDSKLGSFLQDRSRKINYWKDNSQVSHIIIRNPDINSTDVMGEEHNMLQRLAFNAHVSKKQVNAFLDFQEEYLRVTDELKNKNLKNLINSQVISNPKETSFFEQDNKQLIREIDNDQFEKYIEKTIIGTQYFEAFGRTRYSAESYTAVLRINELGHKEIKNAKTYEFLTLEKKDIPPEELGEIFLRAKDTYDSLKIATLFYASKGLYNPWKESIYRLEHLIGTISPNSLPKDRVNKYKLTFDKGDVPYYRPSEDFGLTTIPLRNGFADTVEVGEELDYYELQKVIENPNDEYNAYAMRPEEVEWKKNEDIVLIKQLGELRRVDPNIRKAILEQNIPRDHVLVTINQEQNSVYGYFPVERPIGTFPKNMLKF